MLEEWRIIPTLPTYEASDRGRIRNTSGNKVLRGHRRDSGYVVVCLKGGKIYYVHRLVARAFHGQPEGDRKCVHHKNNKRHDNRASNLMWCSYAENNEYAKQDGLWDFYAEDSPVAALTNDEALEVRRLYAAGEATQAQLAGAFDVTEAVILNVVTGRTYASVTGGTRVTPPRDLRRKLDYAEMLKYREGGMTSAKIASKYGCSPSTARRACRVALAERQANA